MKKIMSPEVFNQILTILHSNPPLDFGQRKSFQEIIDSDEREESRLMGGAFASDIDRLREELSAINGALANSRKLLNEVQSLIGMPITKGETE